MYLGWFLIPGTAVWANTPDNWILGISPLGIGPIGAVVNFAVAYLVSVKTAPVPADVQALVESVRYPKGAGSAVLH